MKKRREERVVKRGKDWLSYDRLDRFSPQRFDSRSAGRETGLPLYSKVPGLPRLPTSPHTARQRYHSPVTPPTIHPIFLALRRLAILPVSASP